MSLLIEQTCQDCGEKFSRRASRKELTPCCRSCKYTRVARLVNAARRLKYGPPEVEVCCVKCGTKYMKRRARVLAENVCKICVSREAATKLASVQIAEKHPQWRGGHRYWQRGKVGRDKEGLSWKRQSKLARERDNYTCQDCRVGREVKGETWKPDVHHVEPFRLSRSHSLENLRSLCRSCHKKADQKIKDFGVKDLVFPIAA